MTLAGSSPFGPNTREMTLPMCGFMLSALKSWPVIIQRWPFSCVAPVWWCRLRISATLSIIRAISGKCSQIWMPVTLVRIGLNLPRTSAGASGFMSQVSRWPGEPTRKIVMQFLMRARLPSTAPAASSFMQVGQRHARRGRRRRPAGSCAASAP